MKSCTEKDNHLLGILYIGALDLAVVFLNGFLTPWALFPQLLQRSVPSAEWCSNITGVSSLILNQSMGRVYWAIFLCMPHWNKWEQQEKVSVDSIPCGNGSYVFFPQCLLFVSCSLAYLILPGLFWASHQSSSSLPMSISRFLKDWCTWPHVTEVPGGKILYLTPIVASPCSPRTRRNLVLWALLPTSDVISLPCIRYTVL